MQNANSLDSVIAASPFYVDPASYWMIGDRNVQQGVESGNAWSITNDGIERTAVIKADSLPDTQTDSVYGPLRSIRISPSKPFDAPGFLAAASAAIAETGTAALVMSTFSYDYIFVHSDHIERAVEALARRGFPQG
jgi:hypothetical protein